MSHGSSGVTQRAFVHKLNKQPAADLRRHVSSVGTATFRHGHGHGNGQGYGFEETASDMAGRRLFRSSCAFDVVTEPLDYEEVLDEQRELLDCDPIRNLVEFPTDDVDVGIVPRKCRTIVPILPDGYAQCESRELDTRTKDCIFCYTSDYVVVHRRYQHLSLNYTSHEMHENDAISHRNSCEDFEHDATSSNDEFSSSTQTLRSFGSRHSLTGMHSDEDKDSLSSSSTRHSVTSNETQRGSWASSDHELRNSSCDPLIPSLLERTPADEVDRLNEKKRKEERQDTILALYPVLEEETIEKRLPAKIPMEQLGHRILVKCLSLKLELDIEPIFASMALYDARDKKKISENFYFDMNVESTKRMLNDHITYQDISTMSRSCIFTISGHPSPDIFVVVRLEKVLQGDINECAEPYMRDDKNREKVRANAVTCCERLGKFRMPFAWTAICLSNVVNGVNSQERGGSGGNGDRESSCSSGNSLERKSSTGSFEGLIWRAVGNSNRTPNNEQQGSVSRKESLDRKKDSRRSKTLSSDELADNLARFRPVTLTVSSFFKQEADRLRDEDLYKFLADLKRPASVLKRLKCLPGTLKLDISPCPEEVRYCLTPELVPLHPYPDDKTRPTKEILEFVSEDIFAPNYLYRNLLYVYPKDINFNNRPGSARNITCKVEFMSGEDSQYAMLVIFNKSSCPEFSNEAYTTISYHNRCPDFYNEIKMRLPAKLMDHHHLLFTFYHVSCQKKVEQTPIETPIGYTWLSTLADGRLQTGDFCLPVMLEKPPVNYSVLSPDVLLPGIKWVDNHKGLFNVTIKAISSVHTQDKVLERFFSLCASLEERGVLPTMLSRLGESGIENELKLTIGMLPDAKPETLVQFIQLVLDKLIRLMVAPPMIGGQFLNVGQVCFESIANIVKNVTELLDKQNDQHGRNGLLTTYIHYQCTVPHSNHPLTSNLDAFNVPFIGNRPVSLPAQTSSFLRSTSIPDLAQRMDADADLGIFTRGLDRTSSMRTATHESSGEFYSVMNSTGTVRKVFHEDLALQWVVSNGKTREVALRNAWFFFELLIKSMTEHLALIDQLEMHIPRKERFRSQFTDDITTLVTTITADIIGHTGSERDTKFVRSLNASLAFFICDSFSVLHRGFVFTLVHYYCKQISAKILALTPDEAVNRLVTLKIDFLCIVCSHEHFIQLNLPFSPSHNALLAQSRNRLGSASPCPSVSSTSSTSFLCSSYCVEVNAVADLTQEFRRQHFLVGLVLVELLNAFNFCVAVVHAKAIGMVRNLLKWHDLDPRYIDVDSRARVASLYLPLIGIVIEALPQIHDFNMSTGDDSTMLSSNESNGWSGFNRSIAVAIAGISGSDDHVGTSFSDGNCSSFQQKSGRSMLTAESSRHLLACFLWVIKNTEMTVLRRWWSDLSARSLQRLLEVLYICVSCFECKGRETTSSSSHSLSQPILRKTSTTISDVKSKLEDVILGQGSARNEMMRRREGHSPSRGNQGARLRWRKDQTQWRHVINDADDRLNAELDAHVEDNLVTEVNMIVLDVLELIVQIASQADCSQGLLASIFRVLLHSLSRNRNTVVLQNLFATQRALVFKFPSLMFDEETEQCADLCLQLLRHCSSSKSGIRSQAAASLYLLMRQNFEIGNNFARVKMQVTMSLSSLAGTNHTFSENYLRRSLKTILMYAEDDTELQDTTFPEQVKDLVFNLHMILSDTVKMKEFQEDPEMLLDLMYRIAKGYQTSPDLRLTWLANMTQKHFERNNQTEAAHCLIHSAALVAEYLHILENQKHLPIGAIAFMELSHNVLEESAISDDVISPDEEGICTGKYFSENGLVGLLEQAALAFNAAALYEAVNQVYKILIPIAEAGRDYKKLMQIHGKLHEVFSKIEYQAGKRVFGTYFRVGFYGEKFGDLDREEFIYKEPVLTKLAEISHRLESFYTERFGQEYFEVIKDSNIVDSSKLNPEKAYIQITYVEPHFDAYELRSRGTYFEKNYNIKRFIFATPFTLDGRAHGELHEQYKRKTMLTTAFSFPYVKTRIQVVERTQVVLTPIEVAIEDIQKKTLELAAATRQEPADPKILQMVLQGSLGTTVNQGPLEVAMVFLYELVGGQKPPSKHQNKLRLCFKDFFKKCSDALHKNKSLIMADQRNYQRELERNYTRLTDKLLPMLQIRPVLRIPKGPS